jgi:competence protein ComEC
VRPDGAGPYLALGALVAGVVAGEHAGPGSGTGALGGAVLLVAVAGLGGRRARALALLGVATLLGLALMQRALDGQVHSPLADAVRERQDVVVDAALAEDPDGSRFSTQVLVRVEALRPGRGAWRDAGGRSVLVHADGDTAPRLAVLDAGDHVRLRGWLRPLEGYDRRFRWRHAVGRFDASELLAFGAPDDVLLEVANPLRATVLRGSAVLSPTERALVAGFLLGDTRELPDAVLDRFRAAGLSHLLAVSGANVAFVLALVGPALRRLTRNGRLLSTLVVLAVFGAMTRWEPSVLRACAMTSCAVLAVHVGRPAHATRTLALAAALLVAIDPFLVHSVGFLLSCGASLGIALLAAPLADRARGPAWLRESIATTAAAQLGVAPVLLIVFGTIPLVAIPANLLAVPLAGPLTAWGLASGCAGGALQPIGPGLVRALQLPTQALADGVLGIADAASRVPIALDAWSCSALAAISAATVLLRRGRMLRRDVVVVPPR